MFKHSKTLWPVALSAAINLFFSIFLAKKIGLSGIVIGTIMGNLCITVFYLSIVLKRVLPIYPLKEFFTIIAAFIIPFAWLGILYYINIYAIPYTIIQLMFFPIAFLMYCYVVYRLVLKIPERQFLLIKFNKILDIFHIPMFRIDV
jgi:peptidoglycan biosynthesis protein MviN/MurJ (putative lipid II flippase)